ncbi:DUF397 domain-containing protein [Streptomyces malaysiensis]
MQRFRRRRMTPRTRWASSSDSYIPCSRRALMTHLRWRKSSFSEGHSDTCVELAADPTGTPHLRESDDPEVVISPAPAALSAFLRAARAGEFDRLGG